MSNSTEAGPSGRSASTEGGHAPPIQQFDANLRLLSDSYLGFFLERCAVSLPPVDLLQSVSTVFVLFLQEADRGAIVSLPYRFSRRVC